MSANMQFTSTLLQTRKMQHLTQEQAAERLGVSARWYQKVEKGISKPNFELTCKIAREFGIDMSLFHEEDAKNDSLQIK